MGFFGLIGFAIIAGLLWVICRNTGEALDKQAALHYEIASLNKKIEDLQAKKPLATSDTAKLSDSSENQFLSINEASLEELMALPGIGKVLGQRIIEARPIANQTELLKVQGVSPEFLDKLGAKINY